MPYQAVPYQDCGVEVVVTLSRDALSAQAEETRQEFRRLEGQWAGRAVRVDLGRLNYVSGNGLGVLIRLHKQLHQSGGHLVLANPNGLLLEVFRVVKLDAYFTIVHEVEADPCFVVEVPPGERC